MAKRKRRNNQASVMTGIYRAMGLVGRAVRDRRDFVQRVLVERSAMPVHAVVALSRVSAEQWALLGPVVRRYRRCCDRCGCRCRRLVALPRPHCPGCAVDSGRLVAYTRTGTTASYLVRAPANQAERETVYTFEAKDWARPTELPLPGRRPFADGRGMRRAVAHVVAEYMLCRDLYNMSPYHRSRRVTATVMSLMCRANPDRSTDHRCFACGEQALDHIHDLLDDGHRPAAIADILLH